MLETPQIIIGCMSWGKWGKNLNTREKTSLIEFCVSQDNTTFDHADIYGDYSTEAEFGQALKNSNIKRENIQLISKCGINLASSVRPNLVKHYNYSTEYIISSVEQSLRNLQTDYLDTLLLHRPSPLMQPEEVYNAVSKLLSSGKIKKFGVSNFKPSQIELLRKQLEISINQIEFSLVQHQAMNNGTLDYLLKNNIKPMSWKPLGGFFQQTNKEANSIKKVLTTLCKKYDTTEDVILLSWLLKHPAKINPVIGTTNRDRIVKANNALNLDLEIQDWFILLEAATGTEVA